MEILKQFGAAVAKRRNELGLSQEELAHKAGVHRTYIGMIERGEKNITLKNMIKISNALGCKLSSILNNLGM